MVFFNKRKKNNEHPESEASQPTPSAPTVNEYSVQDDRVSGKLPNGVSFIAVKHPKGAYILEVHDLSGMFISDSLWCPGILGVAIFCLTEDEFLAAQSSEQRDSFIKLAEELVIRTPKDRLIDCFYIDTMSDSKSPLHLDPKTDTIDDFKFDKSLKLSNNFSLENQSKFFVMYVKETGDLFPLIDIEGYAQVFTSPEYAEEFIKFEKEKEKLKVFAKEYTHEGFIELVRSWYLLGIVRFKVNRGFDDEYMEVQRDEFVPDPRAKEWDYIGSSVRQIIGRFTQLQLAKNSDSSQMMVMFFNGLINTLYDSVYLLSVAIDKTNPVDRVLHLTPGAYAWMKQHEIEILKRESGSDEEPEEPIPFRMDLIAGSDGYRLVQSDDASTAMYMRPQTLYNTRLGQTFLCGFTDFNLIRQVFGTNIHIGLFTFEDIIKHIDDKLSTGQTISGLVINPGAESYFLSKEQIRLVDDKRH